MYTFGKTQKELRNVEVNEFWKCFNEAKNKNTDEATKSIEAFVEIKKKVCFINEKCISQQLKQRTRFIYYKITDELNALGNASGEQNAGSEKLQEAKLNEYNEEVMKLWDKLMSLEVLVVDQLEV